MNDIDWSKAPEGAEAGYLGTSHAYDAWYKRDANGEVLQICPAAGFNDWVSMGGRKVFPVGAVLRPSAPAWVGVGLPPVGLECEMLWSTTTTGEYVRVRILAHDEDRAVVRFTEGERKGEYDSDRQHHDYGYPIFRPIKTAEQIAAEEREAAVKEMQVVVNSKPVAYMNGLYALYDAGYRKQVQP